MTAITVTTAADVVNAGDGKLSLREAVTQANATTAAATTRSSTRSTTTRSRPAPATTMSWARAP